MAFVRIGSALVDEFFINDDSDNIVRFDSLDVAIRQRTDFIHSFITNVVAPKSLDELRKLTRELGECPNIDNILYMYRDEPVYWTVPRWAKTGDVVFFMHSKTSNSHLTAIRTELNKVAGKFDADEAAWLKFWVNHELDVYKLYGGKIFAIGRVVGNPYRDTLSNEDLHWGSNIYANIDDIQILANPIDISEFGEFIFISRQSAITGVFGKEYDKLMALITSRNRIPKRFRDLKADELPLSKINDENWFDVMQRYRRSFFLEQQFRTYSVDHFLREFGDRKTFIAEGRCKKAGCADTFVDNLVTYRGKWLPVEVKLNIQLESDLKGQLEQYLNVDAIDARKRVIKADDIWLDRVMVIDTEGVYLYKDGKLVSVVDWDDMTSKDYMLSELNARLDEMFSWGDSPDAV